MTTQNTPATLRVDREPSHLFVTNTTIRVGFNVYPLRNIAHFGPGESAIFPISWINVASLSILMFFMYLFLAVITAATSPLVGGAGAMGATMSSLVFLLWIAMVVWKLVNPKRHGLLLILNSGDRRLFVSKDRIGIERVTQVVFNLIEWPDDQTKGTSYTISIEGSRVTGNLVLGSVAGSVHSDIGASDKNGDPTGWAPDPQRSEQSPAGNQPPPPDRSLSLE